MEDLTFGEQVKIILSRKGMTIKELAEIIEKRSGKKMSRQNMTQRLGRDNFQEQDMRMIADILACPFHLSILLQEQAAVKAEDFTVPTVKGQKTAADQTSAIDQNNASEQKTAADQNNASEQKAAADQNNTSVQRTASEQNTASEQRTTAGHRTSAEQNRTAAQETPGYEQAVLPLQELQQPTGSPDKKIADGKGQVIQQARSAFAKDADEVDMTIGELYKIHEELTELEVNAKIKDVLESPDQKSKEKLLTGGIFLRKRGNDLSVKAKETVKQEDSVKKEAKMIDLTPDPDDFEPVIKYEDAEEDRDQGDVNPYTGREFQTNSVRMHPNRIGYVQVYDRNTHKWTDMTEWAFLGYQERKKALMGKEYEPPIYLD